jgi:hypothetical protein
MQQEELYAPEEHSDPYCPPDKWALVERNGLTLHKRCATESITKRPVRNRYLYLFGRNTDRRKTVLRFADGETYE